MHCFAQSDKGAVRKENQDRAACAHIRRKGCTVAVVCDGMGGAAGGELASDLAASTFLADFRREMQSGSAVEPAMRHACDAANSAVYDRACAEPDLRGMGTTIVAACVRHGRLTVLHVGDSRAYLAGLRRMQQLTTDHSLVQELVASGQVLPEQAHRHPRRNVITRAVGVGPKVEPDCRTLPFPLGARLLLCTDGLGWYQEAGKSAQALHPGDVVTIPAEVKHWHGAQKDCWFSHIAIECPGEETSNEWLEPVTDAEYAALDADCAQNP